jgi:hypothetical protein
MISDSALSSHRLFHQRLGWLCFLLSLVIPWLVLLSSSHTSVLTCSVALCWSVASSSWGLLSHPFSPDLLMVTVLGPATLTPFPINL